MDLQFEGNDKEELLDQEEKKIERALESLEQYIDDQQADVDKINPIMSNADTEWEKHTDELETIRKEYEEIEQEHLQLKLQLQAIDNQIEEIDIAQGKATPGGVDAEDSDFMSLIPDESASQFSVDPSLPDDDPEEFEEDLTVPINEEIEASQTAPSNHSGEQIPRMSLEEEDPDGIFLCKEDSESEIGRETFVKDIDSAKDIDPYEIDPGNSLPSTPQNIEGGMPIR